MSSSSSSSSSSVTKYASKDMLQPRIKFPSKMFKSSASILALIQHYFGILLMFIQWMYNTWSTANVTNDIHRQVTVVTSSSSVTCQTTGPKPLPKRFLHIVRSRASSFNWQYPLLPLRSSSSFLRLLPRLLVTSICPCIFPSITCCRRQFLRKMWPIQLAFRFLISCRISLCSFTLS